MSLVLMEWSQRVSCVVARPPACKSVTSSYAGHQGPEHAPTCPVSPDDRVQHQATTREADAAVQQSSFSYLCGASPVRPQYVQIRPPLSADVPGASTVRPNLSTVVRGRPRRVPGASLVRPNSSTVVRGRPRRVPGASPVRPQYVQTRPPLSVDVPGASPKSQEITLTLCPLFGSKLQDPTSTNTGNEWNAGQ
ncbi:uncharacterized protein BDZ83DRAFT_656603 [Colletotrichum acutatum]|uniref:Uncharacterized protein n=1 Tax=Glomerella acutata TaxID=27357 RepID=A0AAD8UCL0_GLOAC|nr:uncharacterized protein BDZ83DRAFT_656603 [Colletotrichum acutatum]KAK1712222.1 hypothetical protein BDZ83DRAFT_656603 [Colletotrichum acutatum]